MDLIPLNRSHVESDSAAVHFTDEAAQLANVMTSVVTRQRPVKEVRLYGKIVADERYLQSQTAHISGRIEKLMVNFTGESVHRGQTLALMYAPELVTAQQELLEAARTKESQPQIYEAAKEKLRLWKLTEDQIASLENSGQTSHEYAVLSNTTGIVAARRVNTGDYISQGAVLFDVADLSRIWVLFDAYENDLQFLKTSDILEFTVQALPGTRFTGNISFVDPVIDPVTRVAKVRVEMNNPSGRLKPEMLVTGIVKARLNEYRNSLVIPRSAVLWTGTRSIVYVKQAGTAEPVFALREIGLGPMLGNSYVVTDGLMEGEVIVTRGAFSVDAAAQLEGKPSMMNKQDAVQVAGLSVLNFRVSGNCDMCKERIEKAAMSVKGVSKAVWNLQSKRIEVTLNSLQTGVDEVHQAIALAGHDTERIKADDTVYNALPECCLYRTNKQ